MAFGNYGGMVFVNNFRMGRDRISWKKRPRPFQPIDSPTWSPRLPPSDPSLDAFYQASGHAVLGSYQEGVVVTLHKQSGVEVRYWEDPYEEGRILKLENLLEMDGNANRSVLDWYLAKNMHPGTVTVDSLITEQRIPIRAKLGESELDLRLLVEDNHYLYARLKTRDKIWHGYSGYSVGAGFEHGHELRPPTFEDSLARVYGLEYLNADREARLAMLWPDTFDVANIQDDPSYFRILYEE